MISLFTHPSYLLPPLIAFMLNIGLALFILKTRPQRDLSTKLFISMLISMGIWGLVIFGMRTSPDVGRALIWDRGMPVASLATFVFLYHFTHTYTKARGQRAIIITAYIGLTTTAVLSPSTSLFVEQMRFESYGYAPVVGIGSYIVILSFLPLTTAAIRNLIMRYRESPLYEERNRLIYLVIGVVVIFIGAYLDVLTNLPPAVIKTSIAFSILSTVAVVKYNLLDIRSTARKSLVYVITSSAIAAPYILVILYFTRTIGLEQSPIWLHAIMIVLISIGIRPLYAWSQQLVDRWFYRGRYDYLKALEEFVGQAQSITCLKKLCDTVVDLVGGAIQTSCAYLLLPSEERKGFVIGSATCASELESETIFKNGSATIKWLKRHPGIASLDKFDIHPPLQSLSSAEKRKLEDMGAHLIVPIKTEEGQLSGLLILGQKLSRQPFSFEDKQLLQALSGHAAMAFSNALLYEEVKRSERALRESEEKLQLTFDSMAEGVAVVDLTTNITKVNKALIRMFGYRREKELIGKSPLDLMVERECTEARENMGKISTGKYMSTGEATGLKKDGTELNLELSSAAIRDPVSGIPTGLVTIIEDITKRKQAEVDKREMEKKAYLASRLASVGEMASGIAHEINNPLTGVIGFSQLLMEKDVPEDIRKDLETIHRGAQRVGGIVSRLLAFARQQKPERACVDINQIIETTLALQSYELETNNIEVITQLASDLPRTMADASQLQQVFLNIIINAGTEIKLAHSRGRLLIKTEKKNSAILISFEDDGPGITKENLQRIFDPFFTTREVGKGTGLGLSLCHGIIAEHNGQIYAKSQLGRGATFIVELPIVAEEKQELTESVDEPTRVDGARILVVDDEPTVLEFLRQVLADEGHEVEIVENASDALEKIASTNYGLILLDIKMPGMSGIELYKGIKKTAPSLVRRVIIITGDVMGLDTKKFLSETKVPCIAKPFDAEQIRNEVNRILGESK